jgi:hypothetical protein
MLPRSPSYSQARFPAPVTLRPLSLRKQSDRIKAKKETAPPTRQRMIVGFRYRIEVLAFELSVGVKFRLEATLRWLTLHVDGYRTGRFGELILTIRFVFEDKTMAPSEDCYVHRSVLYE